MESNTYLQIEKGEISSIYSLVTDVNHLYIFVGGFLL